MKKKSEAKEKKKAEAAADRIAAGRLDRVDVARLRADVPLGWYVAAVGEHQDAAAEEAIMELGFDVYLPREKVWRTVRRDRVARDEPFFPGYIFVCAGKRASGDAGAVWYAHGPDLAEVAHAYGVEAILGMGDRPWPLRSEYVDVLREAEGLGLLDRTARVKRVFRKGQTVRITGGLFQGYLAEVLAVEDPDARLSVLLKAAFGGVLPISLDKVEAA